MATLASTVENYSAELARFNASMKERGVRDIENYYWYHTVDLGNGLITPGMYDYRETIASFDFPADMRGMTVLDVGSATGVHQTRDKRLLLISWDWLHLE